MSVPLATLVDGMPGAQVSALDRGLHYGDGLFETLAVRAGEPLLWERHLRRLQAGAARLGIAPPAGAVLAAEAEALCRGAERAVLKVIVTRGVAGRGYRPRAGTPTRVLARYPWPAYPPAAQAAGVTVRLCATRLGTNPRLAGIKHLNRLEQVLARAEWGEEFAEGLMQDGAGRVIEGTMSNLFAVIDGVLCTPDLRDAGVDGILRRLVLERAARFVPCRVTALTPADLERAEELFLTNSLIGVWPVAALGGRRLEPGALTRRVQEALRDGYIGE